MNINFNPYPYTAKTDSELSNRCNPAGKDKPSEVKSQDDNSSKIPSKTKNADPVPQYDTDLKKESCGETTFPKSSIISKYAKYIRVLEEYYSKQNEENKKFPRPEDHINDKYFNGRSPYYIKGLTDREREICATQEREFLCGRGPALNSYDPIIQRTFGSIDASMTDMEWNQEKRGELNECVSQIFRNYGITIPEDADLKLTVDPYEFKIHVSGVNEELAKQIEHALNTGDNGYYLYEHISDCNPGNFGLPEPSQYTEGSQGKMAVYHLVKKLTGYDLRTLENKAAKFYTPDGQDLWEVLKEKYQEYAGRDAANFPLEQYYADYYKTAKMGFQNSMDSNLTIGYKNGFLYDIDTQYGYGPEQKEWQEQIRSRYEKEEALYRKKREEELRRDEAKLSQYERILHPLGGGSEKERKTPVGLYGLDGTFYEIRPISTELIETLSRLFQDGLLEALSHETLRLSVGSGKGHGLDCKA